MAITTPVTEDAGTYFTNAATTNAANAGPAATTGAASMGSANLANATTVEDRLTGILNKGGALMQQAATSGNQQAASRGLLNSSMGVQAAQNAMIANAAPIANADASLLTNTSQFNAGAQNAAAQFNASNQQQVNLANQNAINQNAQFNASNQQQINLANQNAINQANQFNAQNQNAQSQFNAAQQNEALFKALDVNSREQLANIEAQYKTQMQTSASADALYSQVMKNISDIQMSDTVADKGSAINSQLAWLRSGMQMVQNLNGVSGLVTF